MRDVAQNVIVIEGDCGTLQGITKSTISHGDQVDIPLSQLIIGRTARDNIRNPITDEMIVHENEVITQEIAGKITDPELRRSFLENVAAHREVVAEYARLDRSVRPG